MDNKTYKKIRFGGWQDNGHVKIRNKLKRENKNLLKKINYKLRK